MTSIHNLVSEYWILDWAVPIGTFSTNWYSRRSIVDGSEVVGWPCLSGESCSIWCCPPYIRRATPRIHDNAPILISGHYHFAISCSEKKKLWVVFCVFASVKLAKLDEPAWTRPWRPPSSHGRHHGPPLTTRPHATSSHNLFRYDYVVKIAIYYY